MFWSSLLLQQDVLEESIRHTRCSWAQCVCNFPTPACPLAISVYRACASSKTTTPLYHLRGVSGQKSIRTNDYFNEIHNEIIGFEKAKELPQISRNSNKNISLLHRCSRKLFAEGPKTRASLFWPPQKRDARFLLFNFQKGELLSKSKHRVSKTTTTSLDHISHAKDLNAPEETGVHI